MILNKIMKGNTLKTGPQNYTINKNPLSGYSLQAFDEKVWENGNGNMAEYELFMKGVMTYFFPPYVLKHKNMFMCWCLFTPLDSNI